jgi:nucleoside-diphosphate-sugar epimerase
LSILGLFCCLRLILPSNLSPLGALPARFRRERLLIVGCGDVGLRVTRVLKSRARVIALTSSPGRVGLLRAAGATPLAGNLDRPDSLARLAGIATRVIHLAPPPSEGHVQWWRDPRTVALLRVLRRRGPPRSLVYGSTSGVYGDCRGDRVDETWPRRPGTPRAQRRADAETAIRHYGRAAHVRTELLRIPGIYAPDREGGTPRERLLKGTPVLEAGDDVYTNHIHADDLARACVAALWRGASQRAYHVSDDSDTKMGDHFDAVADRFGLPRSPRVSRAEASAVFSPLQMSFLGESRRLSNRRMKRELRLALRYPTVAEGLTS